MALRAKPLEELGLVPAIRQMAEEAASRAGLNLKLEIVDNIPALPPNTEQCLFRVAQEAITNVLKHAKAKDLIVKLDFKENRVSLTIQDNGIGFDAQNSNGAKHFGLLGMKERVAFIKGELNISSQPGAGTIVKLTV